MHDERRNVQCAQPLDARWIGADRHHLADGARRIEAPVVGPARACADVVLVQPLGLGAVHVVRGDLARDVLLA